MPDAEFIQRGDKEHEQFCLICGEKVRLEYKVIPSRWDPSGLRMIEIQICTQHGRNMIEIKEATTPVAVARNSFRCARCFQHRTGTMYGNERWGMVCPDCHETIKAMNAADEETASHLRSIKHGTV
jgi:Zn finger protein HypA/HybF involved in hydrogenase expression